MKNDFRFNLNNSNLTDQLNSTVIKPRLNNSIIINR